MTTATIFTWALVAIYIPLCIWQVIESHKALKLRRELAAKNEESAHVLRMFNLESLQQMHEDRLRLDWLDSQSERWSRPAIDIAMRQADQLAHAIRGD